MYLHELIISSDSHRVTFCAGIILTAVIYGIATLIYRWSR